MKGTVWFSQEPERMDGCDEKSCRSKRSKQHVSCFVPGDRMPERRHRINLGKPSLLKYEPARRVHPSIGCDDENGGGHAAHDDDESRKKVDAWGNA